jgi:hypothetical protein
LDRFAEAESRHKEKPYLFANSLSVVDSRAAGIGAQRQPNAEVLCLPDLIELVVQIFSGYWLDLLRSIRLDFQ